MKGLSRSNLHYMRAFAAAWSDQEIVQQLVGQIPWGHNVSLLNKLEDSGSRLWYAHATIEHGWSRSVLEHQIAGRLHERAGKGASNFERTLPAPDSELVQQVTKDPYNFEFAHVAREAKERELQDALLADIRSFLIEFGQGFAFVGDQYSIEVGGDEFFIDLLFFHIPLNCYVVVELKIGRFRPEDAGQLSFYVTAVDEEVKRDDHAPTVGLLLCASINETVVEYALRGIHKPMQVSGYRLRVAEPEPAREMPAALRDRLPSVPELTAGLREIAATHADALEAVEGAEDGE